MPKIENLTSIQVLDSRGLPTISTEIQLDDGTRSVAMVPSGASTGEKEALELRDGGEAFHGKGVKKAIDNINGRIKTSLIGENTFCIWQKQEFLKRLLDCFLKLILIQIKLNVMDHAP